MNVLFRNINVSYFREGGSVYCRTGIKIMARNKVKVLIVDDSLLFREMMSKNLQDNVNIEVIGTAADAFEAGEKITDLNPDVVVLDINMPKMSGIQFLTQLMSQCPISCIMITASDVSEQEVLDAGAAGFLRKPKSSSDSKTFVSILSTKIIIAAGNKAKLKKLPQGGSITNNNETVSSTGNAAAADLLTSARPAGTNPYGKVVPNIPTRDDIAGVGAKGRDGYIVALGASTGGTDALECVLKSFPKDMPPILVVQHMPPVFTKMYAERLNKTCAVEIKEAEDGDRLTNGVCLIAAGGYHLEVKKDARGYYAKCYQGAKVSGHCPSVDVMFTSVADVAGKKAVAALLTGMGADGAKGLLKIHNKGAFTIGQDKESCIVYGMPMEAYKLGACTEQQPLANVGVALCKALTNGWK